ncbi:MAG TPA: (d)CMP kinase [Nitrospiria bacterium]|nr:(d)CMP kinase [Nitrospiria bacterium]
MNPKTVIVAIDGPAGAGKSTAARALARKLGFLFLDTGALYRAVAWKVLESKVDPEDSKSVTRLCSGLELKLLPSDGAVRVRVDGEDVTDRIRTPEVSQAASAVAALPGVRSYLLKVQREIGAAGGPGVVAEGRDIGTVVFPEAPAKFFLMADAEERVRRRHQELIARGQASGIEITRDELDQRDRRDVGRELAPLKPAEDAMPIDSTRLDSEGVVAEIIRLLREKKVIPGEENSQ